MQRSKRADDKEGVVALEKGVVALATKVLLYYKEALVALEEGVVALETKVSPAVVALEKGVVD